MHVAYLPSAARIAIDLADVLRAPCQSLSVQRFANDQRAIPHIGALGLGLDLAVVQSFETDVHGRLFELLFALDRLRALMPRRLTAVLPYLPYSRSDAPAASGAPIALGLVADMIMRAGADRVVTVALHAPASASAFRVPLIDVDPFAALFAACGAVTPGDEPIVFVAPDFGAAKRAAKIAAEHHRPFAVLQKTRMEGAKRVHQLFGQVSEWHAVLVEDEVNSGETLREAAALLRREGAVRVDALVAHALLGPANAATLLSVSALDRLFVTDSLRNDSRSDGATPIVTVSVAAAIAEALRG